MPGALPLITHPSHTNRALLLFAARQRVTSMQRAARAHIIIARHDNELAVYVKVISASLAGLPVYFNSLSGERTRGDGRPT